MFGYKYFTLVRSISSFQRLIKVAAKVAPYLAEYLSSEPRRILYQVVVEKPNNVFDLIDISTDYNVSTSHVV